MPVAPLTEAPRVPPPGPVAAAAPHPSAPSPKRQVDVALFRNLPGSQAPMVSAQADKTLGELDLFAKLLSKLEGRAPWLDKGIGGLRLGTRVSGPALWGVSSFLQWRMMGRVWQDPTLTTRSKLALTTGAVCNTVGAVFAGIAALPARIGGVLRINAFTANKVAGVAGGIGGVFFNTINFIETMRNPDAKPAERCFAKIGFGIAALGFVAGTAALVLSLPAAAGLAARLPALLPLATKVANVLGIAGFGAFLGQWLLGKNRWVNERLAGTPLG